MTLSRCLQLQNARDPISMTAMGIIKLVNMVQPLNAVLDMYLTDSGIVIFVSDVQPSNLQIVLYQRVAI